MHIDYTIIANLHQKLSDMHIGGLRVLVGKFAKIWNSKPSRTRYCIKEFRVWFLLGLSLALWFHAELPKRPGNLIPDILGHAQLPPFHAYRSG
jgi:hypothetical protein